MPFSNALQDTLDPLLNMRAMCPSPVPNKSCWPSAPHSCPSTIRGAQVCSSMVPYAYYFPDMIAALGEATATPFFINRLRDSMLSDSTGRRILRDRPRITSTTLNVEELRKLPENTIGHEYARWLEIEGVSPDTRDPVSRPRSPYGLTMPGTIYR